MLKLILIVFVIPAVLTVLVLGPAALLRHLWRKPSRRAFWLTVSAFAATPVVLALAAALAWQQLEHRFRLSHVPDALAVREIRYVSEEAWGFGPGGNETGMLVYALPPAVADQVAAGGTAWLAAMPPNRNPDADRGRYENWQPTPLAPDPRWNHNNTRTPVDARTYLFQYGFEIPLDEARLARVNALLNAPGSFYAWGRTGLILVAPREREVVFLYAG